LKGIYCLLIYFEGPAYFKVGKIGMALFKKGMYIYVGSATGIGSTSLEGRIERHKKKNKRCHWHIDYLLNMKESAIKYIIYTIAGSNLECNMAKSIEKCLKIEYPVRNFGSSDCSCIAHLFRVKKKAENNILYKLKKIFLELGSDPKIIKLNQ
jgi:Uri superfamily endonuclease